MEEAKENKNRTITNPYKKENEIKVDKKGEFVKASTYAKVTGGQIQNVNNKGMRVKGKSDSIRLRFQIEWPHEEATVNNIIKR